MTRRNYMNERYTSEVKTGKTRKSSASVKPKTSRASMVRDPAPKSRKQKKAEALKREYEAAQKMDALRGRYEETEEYKRYRKIWWIFLAGAILTTVVSFALSRDESLKTYSLPIMLFAYLLIIIAFYIDLGKIRKVRKAHNAAFMNSKSKEARREQKRLLAERKAEEAEAEAKFAEEEAKREEKRKNRKGLLSFMSPKKIEASDENSSELKEGVPQKNDSHKEKEEGNK